MYRSVDNSFESNIVRPIDTGLSKGIAHQCAVILCDPLICSRVEWQSFGLGAHLCLVYI